MANTHREHSPFKNNLTYSKRSLIFSLKTTPNVDVFDTSKTLPTWHSLYFKSPKYSSRSFITSLHFQNVSYTSPGRIPPKEQTMAFILLWNSLLGMYKPYSSRGKISPYFQYYSHPKLKVQMRSKIEKDQAGIKVVTS